VHGHEPVSERKLRVFHYRTLSDAFPMMALLAFVAELVSLPSTIPCARIWDRRGHLSPLNSLNFAMQDSSSRIFLCELQQFHFNADFIYAQS
jgi:hypothetical protein